MTWLATQQSSNATGTSSRRPGSASPTRGSAHVHVGRRRVRKIVLTAAAVAAVASGGSTATSEASAPAPYSAHSMVYTCCTPSELKQRTFSEAKAMGSSYIRLDVEIGPIFELWGGWRAQPDWSKLDEVMALSRRYGLPVVAVLRSTPGQLSSCPKDPHPDRCAPTDYERYARLVATVAAHARGVIRYWEVLNEPDGSWAFHGTPSQYAWMLRRTYDRIKTIAPEDRVLLGGVESPGSRGWLKQVFDTAGADARHRFDVANVHLRGTIESLSRGMAQFRAFFSGYAFRGPLWVTEHGYPGDGRFQGDPNYRGGEGAQARYLRQSLPTLVRAGAAQVFVTLRDATTAEFGDSEFASEGVLHIGDSAPYSARRKEAFALTQWLAGLWPTLPPTRRDLDGWRKELGGRDRLAGRYERVARRERRAVRRYRKRARRALSRRVRGRYRRLAGKHERRRRRYARQAKRQLQAVGRLRVLIAGYREGP